MTRHTLWRVVNAASPYLGRGSFWSTSPEFVARFGRWLLDTTLCQVEAYRVDVDIARAEHLEYPAANMVDPAAVVRAVDILAMNYQWVSFHEELVEGISVCQFVYLGDTPLPARRVTDRQRPTTGRVVTPAGGPGLGRMIVWRSAPPPPGQR